MKKKIIFLGALLNSIFVFPQVGIGTDTPKATLHVSGNPADLSTPDGIIAPLLTGEELKAKDHLYNSTSELIQGQTAVIVYITEPLSIQNTTEKTENVTSVGYYYFDGFQWQSFGLRLEDVKNIYNSNGYLTDNRIVFMNNNNLLFDGSGNVGIGNVYDHAKLHVEGFIQFASDSDYGVGRIFDDEIGEKYGLTQTTYYPAIGQGTASSSGTRIYTSGNPEGHINFGKYTSATNFIEWGRFAHKTGNFGINTKTRTPAAKLHVVKEASELTPAIIEGCNVYANNQEATDAGLPLGAIYRNSTGILMIRY